MEILNTFDYMYNPVGKAERSVVHKEGLWHETFHCWIIRKRAGKIYVLFQKRSACKKTYPDMLDISSAGHLQFDETPKDGIRELEEELGVKTSTEKMRYLGMRVEVVEMPTLHDKEFQHVYLLEDDTPLTGYKLQEEEVAGLVEVELNAGLQLLYNEVESAECNAVFLRNGELKEEKYNLRYEELISRPDGYYKKIFIMAQRYFGGEKYLSI